MAIRVGSGRHISVAPPTVGWRLKTQYCALSWSTERNPMTSAGVVLD
jgi:hypothetical protein